MIAAMVPMKTSSVFKSRWMALLWAAGIIWFAYDTATSQPQAEANTTNAEQQTDVTGAPVTPDEQNKAADVLRNF
jgi:hypothetical protein